MGVIFQDATAKCLRHLALLETPGRLPFWKMVALETKRVPDGSHLILNGTLAFFFTGWERITGTDSKEQSLDTQ